MRGGMGVAYITPEQTALQGTRQASPSAPMEGHVAMERGSGGGGGLTQRSPASSHLSGVTL